MKKQKTSKTREEKFKEEKEKAIEISHQLQYYKVNPRVEDEIREAKSSIEIDRILRTCRMAS